MSVNVAFHASDHEKRSAFSLSSHSSVRLFDLQISNNDQTSIFCPLCFDAFESPDHFFLDCTVLNIERDVFMNRLKLLVPNVIQYNKVELMNLILTGVTVVGHDSDINILKESIEFIKKSSRFTDRYLPYK